MSFIGVGSRFRAWLLIIFRESSVSLKTTPDSTRDSLSSMVCALGPWKDIRICSSPERIGVRESRRIHGRYTISSDDVANGAQFDDAVCRCAFGVDVHSTTADRGKGIEAAPVRAKPFDIPYRSLVAKTLTA
jgi:hypothetical protein